jgi:outer membrane protein TolC
VRQAQISVETARNDVANYKTQIAQAQNLLNLLVGQPVPENLLPKQQVLVSPKECVDSRLTK